MPLIRQLLAFNAYSEGWALYAEQLADELGAYESDPVGRLGYLQSIAFRACRLVVDTGLHAKRWTREQGVQFFVDANGSNPQEVASEVDRYCSWPGQACGYKVGHSEIIRQRERAQTALGAKFDLEGVQRHGRAGRQCAARRAGEERGRVPETVKDEDVFALILTEGDSGVRSRRVGCRYAKLATSPELLLLEDGRPPESAPTARKVVPMRIRPCPHCDTQTSRLLDETSKVASVWYYRCDKCGHLWHVLKADADGPVLHVRQRHTRKVVG